MSRAFQRRGVFVLLLGAMFLAPAAAWGQAILVNVNPGERVPLPRPIIIWPHPHPWPVTPQENCYKIKSLEVNARLNDQVAKVEVNQAFVNTGQPADRSVAGVSAALRRGHRSAHADDRRQGIRRPNCCRPAKPARDTKKSCARIATRRCWNGSEAGCFKTSVFPIPAGAERNVTLHYTQLCRKTDGVTDFLFPLSTAKYTTKPVEKIEFHVAIESQQPIKNVYSPTQSVEIKRPDDEHAVVSYTARNEIPTSDFRLFYDIGRGRSARAC